jgi:hypothetical protein
LVRGLREIETWLAEVDKRRHSSLPGTSAYFVEHFLTTKHESNMAHKHRTALKLPTLLHSPDSVVFVSPGWEDLPSALPALQESDEQGFLNVMQEELNCKFALQLDPSPNTDWTCQSATDIPGEATRLG